MYRINRTAVVALVVILAVAGAGAQVVLEASGDALFVPSRIR